MSRQSKGPRNSVDSRAPNPLSSLTLGWKLDEDGHPAWWMSPRRSWAMSSRRARRPAAGAADLVTVRADDAAAHTAIIAQSGAGKSFLLGNLIEELLVQTRARCIIFDPNADFRNIHTVRDPAAWERAQYDPSKKRGWLPYDSHTSFQAQWARVSIGVYFGPDDGGAMRQAQGGARLRDREFQIWWPDVDAGILTDELDVFAQSEIHHCHRFVRTIGDLMIKYTRGNPAAGLDMNLANSAEEYFGFARNPDALKRAIQRDWFSNGSSDQEVDDLLKVAVSAAQYVTEPTQRFYFGQFKSLVDLGLIRKWHSPDEDVPALRVLDLPSFPNGEVRRLAISALLADVWRSAREEWARAMREGLANPQAMDERTPTFIVVDEAHNLMPAEPQGSADEALRDQFRTIVAEGRKYGLFLVVVTQRPDKVDPMILSECENKVVMRLASESVVDLTVERLGLEGYKQYMKRCLDYRVGRAMLAGKWSKVPQELFTSARRTMEGGSNLRADHWAVPRAAESLR